MNIIDSYINRPKEDIKPKQTDKILLEKTYSKNEVLKHDRDDQSILPTKTNQARDSSSEKKNFLDKTDLISTESNSQNTDRSSSIVTSSSKDENNIDKLSTK